MNIKLKVGVAFAALAGLVSAAFPVSAQPIEIGVAWMGNSGMADRVLQGMSERLAETAPDIKLEIHRAIESEEEFTAIVDRFQMTMPAMVIMRSNGVKYLAKNPPRIPSLFGAANHPGFLGAVENMDAPEGNITGVTYFLDHRAGLQSFTSTLPGVRSFMLITENGHPGSPIDRDGMARACANFKLKCDSVGVGSVDELKQAMADARGKFDAFVLGSQALLIDNAGTVVDIAGSTPVFAFSDSAVKNGALAGLVADDAKLGGLLADSLVDIVKNGKPVRAVPVKTDTDPVLYLNAETLEKTGVQISIEILGSATIVE